MSSLPAALAPVARLVVTRRTVLPLVGLASWAAFLAWVAAAMRVDGGSPPSADARLAPLLAGSALVFLPAVVGLVTSDALEQLARRPALRLLPDLEWRCLVAQGLVACIACAPLAVVAAALRAGLGPLEALGPALLGFALGALFPGRARNPWAWLAPFGLLVLVEPLCRAARSPLVALALAVVAAAAVAAQIAGLVRLGAPLARGVTWLWPFAPREAQRELTRARRVDTRLAPPERIAGLAGWRVAHRFEQAAGSGTLLTAGRTLQFVLVCYAVALITPILPGMLDGGWRAVLPRALEALVGPLAADARLESHLASNFVMVLWAAPAVVSSLAAAPLLAGLLYPLGRRERAQLAFRVSLASSARACIAVLVVGALGAALASTAAGIPLPRRLPTFAWVALFGLLSAPWAQALWLTLARRMRGRPGSSAWTMILGLTGSLVLVRAAWWLWLALGPGIDAGTVAGYLAALAVSLLAQRALLLRHFARCDL